MLSFILVTAIVCLNLSINTENIYASHLDPSESKIKNITIENGTLTITVSTEKELQDLIDDLDKQTKMLKQNIRPRAYLENHKILIIVQIARSRLIL